MDLGPLTWDVGREPRGFLNQALSSSRRQDVSDTPAQKWLASITSRINLHGFPLIIHNPEFNRNPGIVCHNRPMLVGDTRQRGYSLFLLAPWDIQWCFRKPSFCSFSPKALSYAHVALKKRCAFLKICDLLQLTFSEILHPIPCTIESAWFPQPSPNTWGAEKYPNQVQMPGGQQKLQGSETQPPLKFMVFAPILGPLTSW